MIGCKAGIAISKQKILVRKTKQDDAQEKVWYLGYSVCIVCQSKTEVFRTLLWKFVANLKRRLSVLFFQNLLDYLVFKMSK